MSSREVKDILQQFGIDRPSFEKGASGRKPTSIEQEADYLYQQITKVGEHPSYSTNAAANPGRQSGEDSAPAQTIDSKHTWGNNQQEGVTANVAQQQGMKNQVHNQGAVKDKDSNSLGNDHKITETPSALNPDGERDKLAEVLFSQGALSHAADRILEAAGYSHLTKQASQTQIDSHVNENFRRIDDSIKQAVADNNYLCKVANANPGILRRGLDKMKGMAQSGMASARSGAEAMGQRVGQVEESLGNLPGVRNQVPRDDVAEMFRMGLNANEIRQVMSNPQLTSNRDAGRALLAGGLAGGGFAGGLGTAGLYDYLTPEEQVLMSQKVAALNEIAEKNARIKCAMEQGEADMLQEESVKNLNEKVDTLLDLTKDIKDEVEDGADGDASEKLAQIENYLNTKPLLKKAFLKRMGIK